MYSLSLCFTPQAPTWYALHKPMMMPPIVPVHRALVHRKPAPAKVRHSKAAATAAHHQHQLLLAHQMLSRQQRPGSGAAAAANAKRSPMSGRGGQTRVACPKCGRTFSQGKYLTFHLRWECGRQLSCPRCQHPFNSKSYLNLHVKKCTRPLADAGQP